MKLGDSVRLLVEQPGSEHVGEQVVVPVPVRRSSSGDDEQVRSIEPLQRGLPAAARCHRIAERSGEPVEHGGLQQEVADVAGLMFEHLLGEVVDDEAVVAGEVLDEAGDVVPPLHRQRRQLSAAIHPSVRASRTSTSPAARSSPIASLR